MHSETLDTDSETFHTDIQDTDTLPTDTLDVNYKIVFVVDRINIGRSDLFMFVWCPICVVPYVESFVWSRSSLEGVEPLRGGLEKKKTQFKQLVPKKNTKTKTMTIG